MVSIEIDFELNIYRHDIKQFDLGIVRLDISFHLIKASVLRFKILVT